MPGFTAPEDLRRYVGGIFEAALADEKLAPKLTGTGLVFAVRTTDPEARLTIDLGTGRILDDGEGAPDATMILTSDLANRFWQGKVNLTFAMAKGQVKVEGRIGSLLKLLPTAKSLFPRYVELLQRDGRDDLLVA
ncbi:SCP2 sterol-binding domain-containing protein [Streptomyces sp. NPDC002324]